jgi:hypothetical protein
MEKAPLTPIAAGASSDVVVVPSPAEEEALSSAVLAFVTTKDLGLLQQNKLTFENSEELASFLTKSYCAAFCACGICTCGTLTCSSCMAANLAAGTRLDMDQTNVELTNPYPICCCIRGQDPLVIPLEQISSAEVSSVDFHVYQEATYLWAKCSKPEGLMRLQLKHTEGPVVSVMFLKDPSTACEAINLGIGAVAAAAREASARTHSLTET